MSAVLIGIIVVAAIFLIIVIALVAQSDPAPVTVTPVIVDPVGNLFKDNENSITGAPVVTPTPPPPVVNNPVVPSNVSVVNTPGLPPAGAPKRVYTYASSFGEGRAGGDVDFSFVCDVNDNDYLIKVYVSDGKYFTCITPT